MVFESSLPTKKHKNNKNCQSLVGPSLTKLPGSAHEHQPFPIFLAFGAIPYLIFGACSPANHSISKGPCCLYSSLLTSGEFVFFAYLISAKITYSGPLLVYRNFLDVVCWTALVNVINEYVNPVDVSFKSMLPAALIGLFED